MNIEKVSLVETLRSRGQDAKADWVQRELPTLIDTDKNGALLEMLGVQPGLIPAAPSVVSG